MWAHGEGRNQVVEAVGYMPGTPEDAEPEPDHMLDTQVVVEHTVAVHTEAEHTEAVAVLAVEGNFEHIQEVVR